MNCGRVWHRNSIEQLKKMWKTFGKQMWKKSSEVLVQCSLDQYVHC